MSGRRRVHALSYGLLMAALAGCGGDDGGGPEQVSAADAGQGEGRRCIDEDDDGFSVGCSGSPRDCDDGDPTITDECRRCVRPNEGCPCEPGTEAMHCDPDDMRVTRDGVSGVVICDEGTRWCRDGAWTACEILWQYATFVPDR